MGCNPEISLEPWKNIRKSTSSLDYLIFKIKLYIVEIIRVKKSSSIQKIVCLILAMLHCQCMASDQHPKYPAELQILNHDVIKNLQNFTLSKFHISLLKLFQK